MHRISHHCNECGSDLSMQAGTWDRTLRMRIIRCPNCGHAAVRSGVTLSPWWRLGRRLLGAAPWLAGAAVVLGVGTRFLLESSVELSVSRSTTREAALSPQAVGEISRGDGGAGPWPLGLDPVLDFEWMVLWLGSSLLIGGWCGLVHPRRFFLPALIWWATTSGLAWSAIGSVLLANEILSAPGSRTSIDLYLRPDHFLRFAVIHAASMVPMTLAAQCSRAIELHRQRRRWIRMLHRARMRRERRRSTIRGISIRPHPLGPAGTSPLTEKMTGNTMNMITGSGSGSAE